MTPDGRTLLSGATAETLREWAKRMRILADQHPANMVLRPHEVPAALGLAALADAVAALEERGLNLEVLNIPLADTGDADCGWQLIEHYMTKPQRRVVAEFEKSPCAALSQLLPTPAGEGQ
jgi:hypothetical protein